MRIFAILTAAVLACASGSLFAQDAPADAKADQAESAINFNVPEDKDAEFYVGEFSRLLKESQKIKSQEEADANMPAFIKGMGVIADKLADAEDQQAKQVGASAFQIYVQLLVRTGDFDTLGQLREKTTDPARRNVLEGYLLPYDIRKAGDAKDADALKKIADGIVEKATADVAFASEVSDYTSIIKGYDEALAKDVSDRVLKALESSDDERAKGLAQLIRGMERFNNLVGQEMKVEGLWLDKTEIKWEEFKGKVVLVDFWATWCGPCVAEIPNVRKLYEKYHDAGFEVVGYSLDRDLEALEKFEEKEKLPWKTGSRLLSMNAKEDGKEYLDLSSYYGVRFIPTMILVGKDGKVLDTAARGDHLKELLEKEFPEVK